MAVQAVIIHVLWGKDLQASPDAEARVMTMKAVEAIEDWRLLKQSLAVLTLVMVDLRAGAAAASGAGHHRAHSAPPC